MAKHQREHLFFNERISTKGRAEVIVTRMEDNSRAALIYDEFGFWKHSYHETATVNECRMILRFVAEMNDVVHVKTIDLQQTIDLLPRKRKEVYNYLAEHGYQGISKLCKDMKLSGTGHGYYFLKNLVSDKLLTKVGCKYVVNKPS